MKYFYTVLALAAGLFLATTASAQNGKWVYYSLANSQIPSDTIYGFTFDGSGNTWVMTLYRGLAKFDGSVWTSYFDDPNIPYSDNLNTIAFLRGSLWIGSSGGLTQFDGTTWQTFTTENSQLADDGVNCLALDPQNNLWIGTGWGLNKLTPNLDWTTYNDVNVPEFPSQHLQALGINRHGQAWAGFYSGGGMVKFDVSNPLAAEYCSDTISNFPSDGYLSVAVEDDGSVWAGTGSNGVIWTNNTTAKVFSKDLDPNWIANYVSAVSIDQCGHLWIGTDHGAGMYDGSTWTFHTVHTGDLKSDHANAISVDGSGHVWIGTDSGIAEFKPLPQKPVLTFPPDQLAIQADSITCRWAWDCPGILKYWYELADNPSFTNSHIDTTSTSLTQSASKWDTILNNNTTYFWRVKAENDAGWGPFSNVWTFSVSRAGVADNSTPAIELRQNQPNPFNGETSISFTLPEREHVSLKIYDALGREITTLADRTADAGTTTVTFNAGMLKENGIYFYRLNAENSTVERAMQCIH